MEHGDSFMSAVKSEWNSLTGEIFLGYFYDDKYIQNDYYGTRARKKKTWFNIIKIGML